MVITRREFFQGIVASVVAGNLIVNPKLVLADDKYSVVVHSARELLVKYSAFESAVVNEPMIFEIRHSDDAIKRRAEIFNEFCGKELSFLYEFFRDNFVEMPDVEEVTKLLNDEIKIDILSVSDLQQLSDRMVPIAVTRELIKNHNLRCNPSHHSAFGEFVTKYSKLISAASARIHEKTIRIA